MSAMFSIVISSENEDRMKKIRKLLTSDAPAILSVGCRMAAPTTA